MLVRKSLVLLVFSLILVACSQTIVKPTLDEKNNLNQLTQEEVDKANADAVRSVSKKLKQLAAAAKKSGPTKVKFLASDMYLKASAALMEGDFYTANVIFKHLIELVPGDNFIKQKYAISLIRTGELESSEGILEEIFQSSGQKDPKVGLVLAGVYGSLGKVAQARKTYLRLIAKNPKNEEACIFLGKSYVVEGKTSKAVTLLKQCSKRNPGKAIFDYYIGKIYVEKKDYKTAKVFFRRSLKQDHKFSLSVIALGVINEEVGRVARAEQLYKKHLKHFPNDTLVLSRLVQLMFAQEQFKAALEYAERLSDYEPDNLNLKVRLGILYKDMKQYPKAISTFKELLTFAPDNDKMLYYLGAIYQEINNYEDSIAYFGKVEVDSGLYQDSSFQIAQMLSKLAKDEYLEIKEKGPKHQEFVSYINKKINEITAFKVEFSVVKAVYFESLEETDEAIDVLEYVRSDKAFDNEHRFYLASLFEKEQEHGKATEIVEEIIDYDPQNAHAWNFLGYSLLERGEKLDEALKYIQKAIDLKPNDGYIRDSLGWYYFKTGNLKKAMSEIKKAVAQEPNDAAINKHMAIIYTKMNNFEKAKLYLKKALEGVESESEKQELVKALEQLERKRVPASFE